MEQLMHYTKQNLEVALAAYAAGLEPFPANVYRKWKDGRFTWEKIPIVKGWQQGVREWSRDLEGLKAGLPDEEIIAEAWKRFPHALPGIALGLAGLVVVDPDRHGGPDGVESWDQLVARHGGLPSHPVSITPSGGQHHYFRQPPGVKLGNRDKGLPAAINVRGVGGFVPVQGSIRSDGKGYTVLAGTRPLIEALRVPDGISEAPGWFVELVRVPPPSSSTPITFLMPEGSDRGKAHVRKILREDVPKLAATPAGNRNPALNELNFKLSTMAARGWVDQATVFHHMREACRINGLLAEDPERVERTLRSGWEAGLRNPHPDLPDRPYQRRA
jgi:hypothetical protein